MSIQNTILKLTRELISTFAQLDSWFDCDKNVLLHAEEGRWNAYQVLDHVRLANHYLLKLIEKGVRRGLRLAAEGAPLPHEYNLDEQRLAPIANPNAFRWQRPNHMQPAFEPDALAVRVALRDQLYTLLCLLDEIPNGEGALAKMTMSVDGLGKIDVYQYMYFLCLHARRHLVQLEKNAGVYEPF